MPGDPYLDEAKRRGLAAPDAAPSGGDDPYLAEAARRGLTGGATATAGPPAPPRGPFSDLSSPYQPPVDPGKSELLIGRQPIAQPKPMGPVMTNVIGGLDMLGRSADKAGHMIVDPLVAGNQALQDDFRASKAQERISGLKEHQLAHGITPHSYVTPVEPSFSDVAGHMVGAAGNAFMGALSAPAATSMVADEAAQEGAAQGIPASALGKSAAVPAQALDWWGKDVAHPAGRMAGQFMEDAPGLGALAPTARGATEFGVNLLPFVGAEMAAQGGTAAVNLGREARAVGGVRNALADRQLASYRPSEAGLPPVVGEAAPGDLSGVRQGGEPVTTAREGILNDRTLRRAVDTPPATEFLETRPVLASTPDLGAPPARTESIGTPTVVDTAFAGRPPRDVAGVLSPAEQRRLPTQETVSARPEAPPRADPFSRGASGKASVEGNVGGLTGGMAMPKGPEPVAAPPVEPTISLTDADVARIADAVVKRQEPSVPRQAETLSEAPVAEPRSEPAKPVEQAPVVPQDVTKQAAETSEPAGSLQKPVAAPPVNPERTPNAPLESATRGSSTEPAPARGGTKTSDLIPPAEVPSPAPATVPPRAAEPPVLAVAPEVPVRAPAGPRADVGEAGQRVVPEPTAAPGKPVPADEPSLLDRMRAEKDPEARATIYQQSPREVREAAVAAASAELRAKGLKPDIDGGRKVVEQAIRGEDAPPAKVKSRRDPFARKPKPIEETMLDVDAARRRNASEDAAAAIEQPHELEGRATRIMRDDPKHTNDPRLGDEVVVQRILGELAREADGRIAQDGFKDTVREAVRAARIRQAIETPERSLSPEPAVTEPAKGTGRQGATDTTPQQAPEAGKVPAEGAAPDASKMTREQFKDWYTDPERAIKTHESEIAKLREREKSAPRHEIADIRNEMAQREQAIEKARRGERVELTDAQWDAQHPEGAVKGAIPEPVRDLIRRGQGGLRTDGPTGVVREWGSASAADRAAFLDHLKASSDPLADATILPAEKFRRFVEQAAPVEETPAPEPTKAKGKDPFRKSRRGQEGGLGVVPSARKLVSKVGEEIGRVRDAGDALWEKGLKKTARTAGRFTAKGETAVRDALAHTPGGGAPVVKFLDWVHEKAALSGERLEHDFVYGPKRIDKAFPGYDKATETRVGRRNEAAAITTRIQRELSRGLKKLTPADREAVHDYLDSESATMPSTIPADVKTWVGEYVKFTNWGRDAMVQLEILTPEARAEFPRYMKRTMLNEIKSMGAEIGGTRARIPEIHMRRDAYSYEIEAPEAFVREVADRAGINLDDPSLVAYFKQHGRFATIKFKPTEGVANAIHEAAWKQFRTTMKEMLATGRKNLLDSFNTEVVGAKPGRGQRYAERSVADRRAAAAQARSFIEARKDMPTMSDLIVTAEEPLTPEMRKVAGESRNTAEVAARTLNETMNTVADARFLKDVADRWATERETWYENGKQVGAGVPDGWVAMDGDGYGALKGKLLPEDIANDIKGWIDIRKKDPWVFEMVADHAVRLTSEWKKWRTIRNFRNHAQNAASAPAEMLEAGVNPITDAPLIADVIKRLWKNDIYDPKFREWTKANVTDAQFMSELKAVEAERVKKGYAPLNPLLLSENGRILSDAIDQIAGRVYNFASEVVRAAKYEKERARGLSIEDAVAETNKSTTNFRRVSPAVAKIRKTPFAPFATYATERLRIMKNNMVSHPSRVAITLLYVQAVRKAIELAYEKATGDVVTDAEREGVRRQKGGLFQQIPYVGRALDFTLVLGHNKDGSVDTKNLAPMVPFDQPFRGPRESLDPDEQAMEWVKYAVESAGGSMGPVPAAAITIASGVTSRGKRVKGWGKVRSAAGEFAPPFLPVPDAWEEMRGQQLSKIAMAEKGESTSASAPPATLFQAYMSALLYLNSSGYDPRMAMDEVGRQYKRASSDAWDAYGKGADKRTPDEEADARAKVESKLAELEKRRVERMGIHQAAGESRESSR